MRFLQKETPDPVPVAKNRIRGFHYLTYIDKKNSTSEENKLK